MTKTLAFVIPIRHPENTKNPLEARKFLGQTIRSIQAQTTDDWRAVIVANPGTNLPELPPKFEVCYVDFPPNPMHDQGKADQEKWREFVRLDKGRRVLTGFLHASDVRYLMLVDEDDLISRELTAYVKGHDGENGWYVEDGYMWESEGKLLYPLPHFSASCGTSHIIRRDLLELPAGFAAASEEYIKSMMGSHIYITKYLRQTGHPLAPLPFPGAIYRIGHSGSHSRSSGLVRKALVKKSYLKNPVRLFRALLQFRVLNRELRGEFFGG